MAEVRECLTPGGEWQMNGLQLKGSFSDGNALGIELDPACMYKFTLLSQYSLSTLSFYMYAMLLLKNLNSVGKQEFFIH